MNSRSARDLSPFRMEPIRCRNICIHAQQLSPQVETFLHGTYPLPGHLHREHSSVAFPAEDARTWQVHGQPAAFDTAAA